MKKNKEVKKAMPSDHSMDLPKKDTAKTVWMIVAIVAIVALIGLGIYGYKKTQDLNKKISDQQMQIDELNNTKKTLEDAAAAAAKAATDAAANAVKNAANQQSNDELIKTALTNQCQLYQTTTSPYLKSYKIQQVENNFAQAAYICNPGEDGPTAILKKVNNQWFIVAQGIGEIVTNDERTNYGIPAKYPIPQ